MKGSGRNDDFVYLAVAPVVAALLFFVFYVGGWNPPIPMPQIVVPFGAGLDNLRQFASINQATAIGVLVAIVLGMIGVTWFVMVVLDVKRGAQAFVRWLLRRPPRLVSGYLREEEKPTWSIAMASDSEPAKTYKARPSDWMQDHTK